MPLHSLRAGVAASLLLTIAAPRLAAAQTTATPSRPPVSQGVPAQGAEPDVALLARFDANGNQRLERGERDAARAYLTAHPELRPPMRGQKLPATGAPGPRVTPKDVTSYPASVPLYDAGTVRTIFLTFEHDDWERELADFWHTDVEVPATLEMDGKRYRDVGISFRGNNSFHMVPDGLKRSFSINMDTWRKQDLLGHTSLNLLNANQDPTFLRSVLYLDIAREYIPAPRANFVRIVVNGESWGLYVSQQTFSKELLVEQLGSDKGTRWKSPNNWDDVARDTRKTGTTEAFKAGVDTTGSAAGSLRAFAEKRRAALLMHPEVVGARRQ